MLGILSSKSRRAERNEEPIKEYLLLTRYDSDRVRSGEMLSLDDVQKFYPWIYWVSSLNQNQSCLRLTQVYR